MNLLVIALALGTSPAEAPKPVPAPTFEVRENTPQLADGGTRMPPKGRVTLADGGTRMPPKGLQG